MIQRGDAIEIFKFKLRDHSERLETPWISQVIITVTIREKEEGTSDRARGIKEKRERKKRRKQKETIRSLAYHFHR